MVAEEVIITLSGGAPWGFRLQGGVEHQKPLQVAKVRRVTQQVWQKQLFHGLLSGREQNCVRFNSLSKEKWNISWDILGGDLRSCEQSWNGILAAMHVGLRPEYESSSCLRTVTEQRTNDWLGELKTSSSAGNIGRPCCISSTECCFSY